MTKNAERFYEVEALYRQGEAKFRENSDSGSVSFLNVAVLGLQSQNVGSNGKPRKYAEDAVRGAIGKYEGTRVYLDHNTGWAGPSVDRLAGKLEGVYWDEGSKKLRASELVIHDTDKTAHALKLLMAQPEHIGMSHDISGKENRKEGVITEISQVHSVDVVSAPATNVGLYESTSLEFGAWTYSETTSEVNMTNENTEVQDSVKEELDSLRNELEAEQAKVSESDAKVEAAEGKVRELESELAIEKALATADLPEAAQSKLREALAGKTPEEVDGAVKAEIAYLEELGLDKPDANVKAAPDSEDNDDNNQTAEVLENVQKDILASLGLTN